MADGAAVPPKRIAVIAVHGVGDQQPLESARAIGDLLQNIDVDMSLTQRNEATVRKRRPFDGRREATRAAGSARKHERQPVRQGGPVTIS